MAVEITKADGVIEAFDERKLETSLQKAGASNEAAHKIANDVAKTVRDKMATHDIYTHAFKLLREHRKEAAARYSLKRAIMDFGPSGFPFEAYIAELFRAEGYSAAINVHVQGICVEHEVDVLLTRSEETIYVEAKFHNTVGFKTDLHVALYVQARFEDIKEAYKNSGKKMRGMLVTNTKFTSLALNYGRCKGLEFLGWEYPAEKNLHDRIESLGLFPITTLTTLSSHEKALLLSNKIVLCRDLSRQEDALARAGVSGARMQEVLTESGALCGH